MARLILLLGMLLISGMVSAKIYKWVDAQGVVHFQDHPRGTAEKFSTDEGAGTGSKKRSTAAKQIPKNQKLLKALEKSRKQREKALHKKLAEQRKQDQRCIKLRDQAVKMEARMKKQYSEFSNDRPPSYALQQKKLQQRKKYLDENCR